MGPGVYFGGSLRRWGFIKFYLKVYWLSCYWRKKKTPSLQILTSYYKESNTLLPENEEAPCHWAPTAVEKPKTFTWNTESLNKSTDIFQQNTDAVSVRFLVQSPEAPVPGFDAWYLCGEQTSVHCVGVCWRTECQVLHQQQIGVPHLASKGQNSTSWLFLDSIFLFDRYLVF